MQYRRFVKDGEDLSALGYGCMRLPAFLVKKPEQIETFYKTQRERLDMDYIDYYLMHMLDSYDSWATLKDFGILEFIEEKKAKGEIRHIGFSFRCGDSPRLRRLLRQILLRRHGGAGQQHRPVRGVQKGLMATGRIPGCFLITAHESNLLIRHPKGPLSRNSPVIRHSSLKPLSAVQYNLPESLTNHLFSIFPNISVKFIFYL